METVIREQVAIRPVSKHCSHDLPWSDDREPICVLAADKRVSDFLHISNVDINVVADSGFEFSKFGAKNVDSSGVA